MYTLKSRTKKWFQIAKDVIEERKNSLRIKAVGEFNAQNKGNGILNHSEFKLYYFLNTHLKIIKFV